MPPRNFCDQGAPHDFDVAIIGAGPGGLACASQLAQSDLKVVLIEDREIGGVCLNRGCIPTKTLLESVGALRLVRRAATFGIGISGEISVDFSAMQSRKREIVASLRTQALEQLKESVVHNFARARALCGRAHARNRRPRCAPVDGGSRRDRDRRFAVQTADQRRQSRRRFDVRRNFATRKRAQIANRDRRRRGRRRSRLDFPAEVGARVCILEREAQVLPGEDEDIQRAMRASLEGSGIEIVAGADLQRIGNGGDGLVAHFERDGQNQTRTTTLILMAAGRKANLSDLNLEAADVRHENGHIDADENNETSTAGVWAIGDCIRRVGWAHQAALEGRRVADNIRGLENDAALQFIPSCYYTFPEVATVGLNLQAAHDLGIEARAGQFPFRANGRAATAGDENGFVKIVVEFGTDKILGAQIIGPRATELINEIVLAMRQHQSARTLADALHAHPTFAEVLPGAARAALEG